jgi:hypothetical protein
VLIVYGYILLFGASFPLAPIVLVVYLMLYIRIKSWSLTHIYKRPYPYKFPGSMMWLDILTILVYLGAASNLAIALFTANVLDFDSSRTKWEVYLILEHILIIFMIFLQYAISSTPFRNIYSAIQCSQKWSQRINAETFSLSYPTSEETLRARNLSYESIVDNKKVSCSSDKIGYVEVSPQ